MTLWLPEHLRIPVGRVRAAWATEFVRNQREPEVPEMLDIIERISEKANVSMTELALAYKIVRETARTQTVEGFIPFNPEVRPQAWDYRAERCATYLEQFPERVRFFSLDDQFSERSTWERQDAA